MLRGLLPVLPDELQNQPQQNKHVEQKMTVPFFLPHQIEDGTDGERHTASDNP